MASLGAARTLRCISSTAAVRAAAASSAQPAAGARGAGCPPPVFAATLPELHREAMARFKDRPLFGVRHGDEYQWRTYGDVEEKIDGYCHLLHTAGVGPGDSVAAITSNRPAWASASFAAQDLGAQFVPMYQTQTARDWEYIINDSEAKVVFAANDDIREVVEKLGPKLPHLAHVYSLDSTPVPASGPVAPATPAVDVKPDDVATLIYTSGTTGNPKGVMLTHDNILSNVKALASLFEGKYSCEDVHLSFLPWAHSYGQTVELYTAIAHGSALGLVSSNERILEELGMVKPTILVSVPKLFEKVFDGIEHQLNTGSRAKYLIFQGALGIAKERREALNAGTQLGPLQAARWQLFNTLVFQKVHERFGGRLRYMMTGGASLSRRIQHFFADIGIPIHEGYGLTETSPVALGERFGLTEELQGGLRPIPGVSVMIVNPDTLEPVPVGTEGELCICGPNVMKGYYKQPDETAKCIFQRDGRRYFRSGDMAREAPDGEIKITGRIKELYKLDNGKYVVPGHIEAAIVSGALIQQALVEGKDQPFNVALVVPDPVALGHEMEMQGQPVEEILAAKGDQVRALVAKLIDTAMADPKIKAYERVRDFLIVPEFTGQFVTPKQSLKRHLILDHYASDIAALYQQHKRNSDG